MKFLAHKAADGREQSLQDHLQNTARLCAEYASAFTEPAQGELVGLLHDLGKASAEFQKRLSGGPKVDHSSAGTFEAQKLRQIPAAMCIAGHHGGLLNAGSDGDAAGKATVFGRLEKARKGQIPQYESWTALGIELPKIEHMPEQCANPDPLSAVFYIRMLYSALVDADFLETETFMTGKRVVQETDIKTLNRRLDSYIKPWFPAKTDLNQRRCNILSQCLNKGEKLAKGLYTLTVPTGGGKTVASLAFALRHAKAQGLKRVIYVIPYTNIIEQTVQVFKDILGEENVLAHHSQVVYDENEEIDALTLRLRNASENWEFPVIVTTAVQFFESLYANKASKCRKLHNMAKSVIVFDEAQNMPVSYLRPCVHAIAQLVRFYNVSAVLCTATQPALEPFFNEYLPDQRPVEICSQEIFEDPIFKRVSFENIGRQEWQEIADRLNEQEQGLCIVNTRASAEKLYSMLDANGSYHLTSLMYPAHRQEVLQTIRQRLKEKKPCRVVATSLIEAGVDVDFPVVYRELSGLDSILQAAGRCNREGKRQTADSMVYLFESTEKTPEMLSVNLAATRQALKIEAGLDSQEAIRCYFQNLYGIREESLDKHEILRQLQRDFFPFKTVAEQFHLIEQETYTVYIPTDDNAELVAQLRMRQYSRNLFRKLGPYSVSVYRHEFEKLYNAGMLEMVDEKSAILLNLQQYDEQTGLLLQIEGGVDYII